MRILYGVCGEGMGHATRAGVVGAYLTARGHHVTFASSGRAEKYLARMFPGRTLSVPPLELVTDRGQLRPIATAMRSVARQVSGVATSVSSAASVLSSGVDRVVTDFDPWSARLAAGLGVPLVSLDSNHAVTHLECPEPESAEEARARDVCAAYTMLVAPLARRFLVCSLAPARARRDRTTLHRPVLRPEVLDSVPERGGCLLFYLAGHLETYAEVAARSPVPARVYGTSITGRRGSAEFIPTSDERFLEDLRTCRAVVCGAGHQLPAEAAYLGKPMLVVPIAGHGEQLINAAFVEAGRLGWRADRLTDAILKSFLERAESHRPTQPCWDNRELFRSLDEALLT